MASSRWHGGSRRGDVRRERLADVVVDTSVLVAIARDEPEAPTFRALLQGSDYASISTATLMETSLVLRDDAGQRFLDRAAMGLDIIAFDERQLAVAREAHRRYGTGSRHRARLNYGDCFSYALAITTGEPLLFKGDHFRHTDVTAAYVPD
ncbi:type II toxin-antitoxin system VapC family toxin [Nocardioides agariphilus]|uniref:type II toxin-antitoxin system VapC family toxin n=1 Tax=Nocardioides agariphilus TaxID=433664 RepID=UPI003522CA05